MGSASQDLGRCCARCACTPARWKKKHRWDAASLDAASWEGSFGFLTGLPNSCKLWHIVCIFASISFLFVRLLAYPRGSRRSADYQRRGHICLSSGFGFADVIPRCTLIPRVITSHALTTTTTTTTTITSAWGHTVLTSARVFMGRRPIPPLCGGAVQALPNFQTTLRDHPHPASRPMTFGHFTSWHADDLGYYTGADDDDDDATTRACGPHGIFCKGLWPLAGARTPLKERAKVARASSCNINVEKPLVF